MILLAWLSTSALAGVEIGVGVGVAADLPDQVSTANDTKFGVGPELEIPIAYRLAPYARLRATLRTGLGFGKDRLGWTEPVNGQDVAVYQDSPWAMVALAGLTAGADVELPLKGKTKPYFGSEVGVGWFGTYHSRLTGPEAALVDPGQNDPGNPKNVDPYSTQAALLTDLHVGIEQDLSEKLALTVEPGYSLAFLGAAQLKKSPADLKAEREPYGWNALRIGVGLTFRL